MKKLLIAGIAVIFTVTSVNAQNNSSFSLGAELSLPVGLFGDVYSFGYGASGQGNFGIGGNAAITAYAGYINYSLKSTYGSGSQGYIPVLGGVEFGFAPSVFGSAQLGLTFYTKGGGSAFTYSPGIGFRLSKNFSALVKYVGQSKAGATSSAVGVRVAYAFGK